MALFLSMLSWAISITVTYQVVDPYALAQSNSPNMVIQAGQLRPVTSVQAGLTYCHADQSRIPTFRGALQISTFSQTIGDQVLHMALLKTAPESPGFSISCWNDRQAITLPDLQATFVNILTLQ